MSSKKVVDLVNTWAEFEAEYPDASIEQFCHWVIASKEQHNHAEAEYSRGYGNDGYAAQLLSRLSRYAQIYSKDILGVHGIESVYEWGFMMHVLELRNPKKSELIEKQLTGFTSGIGIINRLIKRKLLTEITDETDKRSKRLSLTKEGFALLQSTLPDMDRLSKIIFMPLNDTEKNMLLSILQKLDTVHQNAFQHTELHTVEGLNERISKLSN
jgi:DNA-binding MarR family transcriptional regulator